MKYIRHIFLLLLLLFSTAAFSQKTEKVRKEDEQVEEKKASKSKRQVRRNYLGEASALREKSPTEAIKLLEEALLYARKDGNQADQAEAYTMLGNIYEDIGQHELALQRYQQALDAISRSKEGGNPAPIHQRMGQLHLELKSDKAAELSFKRCIEFGGRDQAVQQRCEEGLADVALLRGNANASISQLDNVEKNYKMDSASTARLEAKRSNVYIQQNDFPRASESYLDAINSLPEGAPVCKEDYQAIEQAQTQLLAYEGSDVESKVEIAKKSPAANDPVTSNDEVISGNLKVATVYEAEKKWTEAERFIARSKALLNDRTDAALAAEVFGKSAEINRRKGNLTSALDDMQRYVTEREKAIAEAQAELEQQVEIVKGQQRIDVQEKDYDIEVKERALLQSQLSRQRIIIGLLSLLLLASLVFLFS
ncbi:MAG: tetratricopeptide repeat protein [Saprospiraceae bacterium]|nr:tetratricopeptide repeat protein [Saprospiraceae bacterium]